MRTPNWEKKPFVFLLLAVLTILAGTIVTMILPFAWVNTEADRIESVTPYTVLEQAGRDIYIREGCNNCHTQTVRPLVAEVLRYGDYSKSGEFVYDRPHLWGSRRTGPDLARLGGKYPDAWHYQHMEAPTAMIPKSNMPSYAFLNDRPVDPAAAEKAMQVLGFPYQQAEIEALDGKTEMDAMVAYLQKLGTGIPWREAKVVEVVGELNNPFPESGAAIEAGKALYAGNCAACHGSNLEGGIGPELAPDNYDDAGLFELIYSGIPDNGMPAFAALGSEKVWQIVNFIRYGEH
ncbi:MAG TPA: cytochrome-c oxidase, cbb3-type subunit II [Desulfuromonadales bacterium]|nr:cytochrome-c oxidase, cbb3-type subunit II [Desulfuromonadales bacterium]